MRRLPGKRVSYMEVSRNYTNVTLEQFARQSFTTVQIVSAAI